MSAPLNNDTLATAYLIKNGDGNYLPNQSNLNAVNTSPNGEPTSSPGAPLWYCWRPKTTYQGVACLFGIAAASGTGYDSYIRIYTGPAPVNGVYPTFNQLVQVGVDDDSGIQPSQAQDGYTLPASYPSNNASVRVTIDSTKTYYIAAGGYSSNRNGNWAPNFAQAKVGVVPAPFNNFGRRQLLEGATHYWPLTDTTLAFVADMTNKESGAGTLVPNSSAGAALLPGVASDASLNCAATRYVQVGDQADLSPHAGVNGLMTLEALVFYNTLTNAAMVVSKGGATGPVFEYDIRTQTTGVIEFLIFTSSGTVIAQASSPAGTIVPGTPYHVVATYDRAAQRAVLFVNGLAVATITAMSGVSADTIAEFHIGHRQDAFGTIPDGLISHVAVYPYAFTAAQAASHYRESLRGAVSY